MSDFRSSLATIATAAVVAISPAYSADKAVAPHENVTAQTRLKVANIRKEFPSFKLSPDAQQCLDGKLIDPDCDSAIEGEADIYKKKQQVNAERQQVNAERQQVNAREQQVNAREQQLLIVKEAWTSIAVVIWLIQLGLYIDFDRIPSEKGDYMAIVMADPATPTEIKDLFTSFLKRKKNNDHFTWKWDGERLIWYAKQYLDRANVLQSQITDATFKEQISAMYIQANTTYIAGREKLTKKG